MHSLHPHLAAMITAVGQTGGHHPTAKLMTDLGMLLFDRCEFDLAESLFRNVVALDHQKFDSDYPLAYANQRLVARVLSARDRKEDAVSLLRTSVESLEKCTDPDSPWLCDSLDELAHVLYGSKRLAEAESTCRRSLAILEKTYGRDHWSVACGLDDLAFILHLTDPDQAAFLLRQALDIDERVLDLPHAQLAAHIYDLALALVGPTNSLIGIEPLLHRAAEIYLEIFGPDHVAFATSLYWHSILLAEKQEFDKAEEAVRKARQIHENHGGKTRWLYFRDLSQLALICKSSKRYTEAEELLTRLRAEYEQRPGFASLSLACCLNNTAQLHHAMQRNDTAEVLFSQSLDIYLQFGADTSRRHRQLPFSVRSYRRLLGEMKYSEDEIDARLRVRLEPFGISANDLTIPAASL
jgi:tetratricopeptide (TPR) repeat protein